MRYQKGSFITIPNKNILKGKSAYIQSVYLWLCNYADDDGICYPSLQRLADESGMSREQAKRSINDLETIGILEKTTRKNDNGKENLTNQYQLMIVETPSALIDPPSPTIELTPPGLVEPGTQPTLYNSNIGEAETSPTFDAFLKTREYYQDTASMPDANDCYPTVWYSADGKQVKKSELDSLRREYNRTVGKTQPQKPQNDLQRIFALFSFNPAWKSWSSNRTQRRAAEELLNLAPLDSIATAVRVSQKIKKKAFAPQVSTPYDLLNKMDKVKNFIQR